MKTSKSVSPTTGEHDKHSNKGKGGVLNEQVAQTATKGESKRHKGAEQEARKPESPRHSHEPEPIHIHMGRADSSSKGTAPQTQESSRSKESRTQGGAPDTKAPVTTSHQQVAPNPQVKQVQGSAGIARTGSFQKKRESQKRRSMEHLLNEPDQNNSSEPRYPTGTQSGTLADLKKQRAEQHKFGNGLDAQVQSLFLHSLSGDGKKYSSSNVSTVPQTHKESSQSSQNGKNVKNNNNTAGQSRPPTFISDNGPLRRFSAPSSAPVIGEDDKFKNDCCVIL